jgi:hypothetical protein
MKWHIEISPYYRTAQIVDESNHALSPLGIDIAVAHTLCREHNAAIDPEGAAIDELNFLDEKALKMKTEGR